MAWLIGDSFDFYNNGANNDMACAGNGCFSALGWSTSATTRFGVGQAAFSGNAATTFTTVTFTNSTTVYINFAFNVAGAAGTDTQYDFWLNLRDTTNTQCCITTTRAGNIKLFAGAAASGTQLAASTGGTACPVGSWTHLQIKIVIDNAAGSIDVRANGSTTSVGGFPVTGLNTRNGSTNAYINNITSGNSGNQPTFDDFYVFNDQSPAPLTWQGDVRAVQLMPNADSSVTWTPSSGANNFSRISEAHEDGDTSYVSTTTTNNVDLYGIPALATTPNAIIAVVTKAFFRMDDAGPHTIKTRLSSGGTTSDSGTVGTSTSYNWLWNTYVTDPHTSAAWTPTAVAAALIGPFMVS